MYRFNLLKILALVRLIQNLNTTNVSVQYTADTAGQKALRFKYNKCIGSILKLPKKGYTLKHLNTTNVSVQFGFTNISKNIIPYLNTTNVSVQL